MPKQRGYRSNIDEPFYRFPRLRGEDEDNAIFAPAGEKTSTKGELKGGYRVGMVVECHLELVSGDGHGRVWLELLSGCLMFGAVWHVH